MTTLEFLSQLREQNIIIKLTPEGDQLKISAPKGALSAELRSELQARKEEILTFLQEAAAKQSANLPEIEPVDRDNPLRLSFAQERIWKLHQLAPDSANLNVPVAWRLAGRLARNARRSADRHVPHLRELPVEVRRSAEGAGFQHLDLEQVAQGRRP